jgi:hypothetical protein
MHELKQHTTLPFGFQALGQELKSSHAHMSLSIKVSHHYHFSVALAAEWHQPVAFNSKVH